VETIHLNL